MHFQALDAEFEYGFEYMGSAVREVITPLTEKVFLCLTRAVHAYSGGLCMAQAVRELHALLIRLNP